MSFEWTWGDGATGEGALSQHGYEANGTYSLRLKVTDDRGASASASTTVVVRSPLDTDGDGLLDTREAELGTNPTKADTNDDGISDGVAIGLGMSAIDLDMDDDGVANADERRAGTDPFAADTDGDGTNDGTDAFPLDPDRSTLPVGNPEDHTPPSIILVRPRGAVPRP